MNSNTRRVLCPLCILEAVYWMLLHCDMLARSPHCSVTHPGNNTFDSLEKKRQNSELEAVDNHFVQN